MLQIGPNWILIVSFKKQRLLLLRLRNFVQHRLDTKTHNMHGNSKNISGLLVKSIQHKIPTQTSPFEFKL